jgi:transposase-like protein
MESDFIHERDGIWRCTLDGLLYRKVRNLLPISFENGEIVGDNWPAKEEPEKAEVDIRKDKILAAYDGVKSARTVAKDLGIHREVVRKCWLKNGLSSSFGKTKERAKSLSPEILAAYDKKTSANAVAKRFGVTVNVVTDIWRKSGIEYAGAREKIKSLKDAIVAAYDGIKTQEQVAKEFGVCKESVKRYWDGEGYLTAQALKIELTKKKVLEFYDGKKSANSVANELGVTTNTVLRVWRSSGLIK